MFCQAIKNKSSPNLKCTNKCKPNEIFCGIHLKSKDTVLFSEPVLEIIQTNNFDKIPELNIEITEPSMESIVEISNTIMNTPDVETVCIESDKKIIYPTDELFEMVMNNKTISVYSLRNSIKKTYVDFFVKTKGSKQQILNDLRAFIEKERYWKSNMNFIVKIQKTIRGWSVYRRKQCLNDTDILTFGDKYEIPKIFYTVLKDAETGFRYGYDLRTIYQILSQDVPMCPYTGRKFTDEEQREIAFKIRKANFMGIYLGIDVVEFDEHQRIEMKMKDVFHMFNMLDNYTNYKWFKNLSLAQLCDLYFKSEDIWNYRIHMDNETRQKIIYGPAFRLNRSYIMNIGSKPKLQEIILDEYARFATEGVNREEKKLGVMLMLTGLVEVSGDAADALPHLVQV